MQSQIKIFTVFLFATVLLIPAASLANAQEYENNKGYGYENYIDNNKPDYTDKDGKDYYYHYPVKDKNFKKLVQECEDCFLTELGKLDRKTADKIFYALEDKFGSLTELCKLIASGKIDRIELIQYLG